MKLNKKTLKNKKRKGGNNENYTAIIIEPRKHRALQYVLLNALKNLSDKWNIIVFHGNLNKEYVENIINTKLSDYKNRIKTINLNIDNLDFYNYNSLMLDKSFYNNIPTETFLVFQTDSLIISKNKDVINEFLKYDYVGAPFDGIGPHNAHLNKLVGNGGLSLRKKSKMLEIIDSCKASWDFNGEDRFFSFPCNNIPINKPSFEEAQRFCSQFTLNENSFGIHKTWYEFPLKDIEKLFPEVRELFSTLWIDT
jgi:hypothetical protein